MSTVFYFICEWGPNPKAYLTTDLPEDYIELGSVKWRGQPVTVKIISNVTFETDPKKETCPAKLYPLLKSNLQKQVRRQKKYAVATASRLWDLNKFEMLRRLPIIAAEDSELTVETAVVVWLMVVKSKHWLLTDDHKRWVLGYVDAINKHSVCRRLEIKYSGIENDCNNKLQAIDVMNSNHPQRDIIGAILLRTAYGGLRGDPPMVSRCLDYLICKEQQLPTLDVQRWTQPLPRLLINKAAIDHHICYELIDKLHQKFPQYSPDYICTVIWEKSSGFNNRKERRDRPEWKRCWKDIEPDFRRLTKDYLARILKRYPKL